MRKNKKMEEPVEVSHSISAVGSCLLSPKSHILSIFIGVSFLSRALVEDECHVLERYITHLQVRTISQLAESF